MRFRRTLQVPIVHLDANTPAPQETGKDCQLTMELRALKHWEDFDEGTVRWATVIAVAAGGAGNFSGWMITGVPGGARYSVDEIKNLGAGILQVRAVTAVPSGWVTIGNPQFEDGRFGPSTAAVSTVSGNSSPTPGGSVIDEISVGERVTGGRFSSGAGLVDKPNNTQLMLVADTAVVAIRFAIRGRLLPQPF